MLRKPARPGFLSRPGRRSRPEVSGLEERALLSSLAVFEPSTATFFIEGRGAIPFGQGRLFGGNPIPIPADYRGDGQVELAVFEPSTATFFVEHVGMIPFGQGTLHGGDPVPLAADFTGDGRVELAVFEPSTATFFVEHVGMIPFGQGTLHGGDPVPLAADFTGDGRAELAVFEPSTATFFIQHVGAIPFGQGRLFGGDPEPAAADFTGDGRVELAVLERSTATFFIEHVGIRPFGQGRLFGGDPVATPLSAAVPRIAPTTTATIQGRLGPDGIYVDPVHVILTAHHPIVSPAALTTQYRVNGGPWITGNRVPLAPGSSFVEFFSTSPPRAHEPIQSITVTVADATAPPAIPAGPLGLAVSASPTILWPPNHRIVPVTVTATVSGATELGYVLIDEYGELSRSEVVTPISDGRFTFVVDLIASRLGQDRDGRHYTILVTARDGAGNTLSDSVVVVVPHDMGRGRR